MHTHIEGVPTLAEHAAAAQATLDAATWAYVDGGAGEEHTLRANAQAWQALALRPRVLRPLAGGHTRVQLLGRTWPHPILAAPMAAQAAVHPQGEHAMALACASQGAGLVLSLQATARLEDVARLVLPEPERGPLLLQLYWQSDRGFLRELMARAAESGYEALMLTVDAPVAGIRDRERRAGWALPAHLSSPNLAGLRRHEPRPLGPGQSRLFDDLLLQAPTWAEVEWLAGHSPLPLLLKGISHPQDARLALASGAAGLVVSNHGGRTLDTQPPTAQVLAEVVQAVAGQVPVLVDGGLRRGTDVLKALALGATAVLVGRPLLHGLAHGGALGVAQVLRLLRDELEVAMALSGCARPNEAGPWLLA